MKDIAFIYTVQYKCKHAPVSAIFRFDILADTEEKAYAVAKVYEMQLRKDNPWFDDAISTMLRLA